ncbi:MAG TPA: YggT family protein [Longimicrobium sp.]|nr:YggT family protein [Longimicrobium sp.]
MGWNVLYTLLSLIELLIIVRVLMSWIVSPHSQHPAMQLLRSATDVILEPIRSILPRTGMFDLAPMVAILLISLLQGLISGMRY